MRCTDCGHMNAAVTKERKDHVPAEPALVLPGRVNAGAVETLEQLLGGRDTRRRDECRQAKLHSAFRELTS